MSFNLEDFITHPSKEELDSLLKPQLRQVVQRLKIEHEENAKKAELKRLILDYLVEEDLDVSGVEHPVCYFSKKFEKGQKNYCTSEKELLALVLALQHFEIYVSAGGYPVTVYTDHNPLTFLHRLKNKNQRLLQWSILLQQYTLDIQHIKGQENVIADTLSRVSSHTPDCLC